MRDAGVAGKAIVQSWSMNLGKNYIKIGRFIAWIIGGYVLGFFLRRFHWDAVHLIFYLCGLLFGSSHRVRQSHLVGSPKLLPGNMEIGRKMPQMRL